LGDFKSRFPSIGEELEDEVGFVGKVRVRRRDRE
jgi:hypothetical protein